MIRQFQRTKISIFFSHLALIELAPHDAKKLSRSQKITNATASTAANLLCPICKAIHFINKCPKFIKKCPSQRLEIIKQANRCLNCLSAKHMVQSCPSKYFCRTCQKKHHSMLHLDSVSSSNDNTVATTTATKSETNATESITTLFSTSELPSRPPVLLATARVRVGSIGGRFVVVRTLLDQGSE